jgi:hypothetical protein
MKGWLVLALMGMLAHDASYALGDVKFGPEFSFTNLQSQKGEDHFEDLAFVQYQHLHHGQADGAKFTREIVPIHYNIWAYRFTSPNGWWFENLPENLAGNGGTIEVTMSPGTPEYFEHFESDMQDAIFASAYNTNLVGLCLCCDQKVG